MGLALLGKAELMEKVGLTAVTGGLFHIINHAFYKGLLFLTAGSNR